MAFFRNQRSRSLNPELAKTAEWVKSRARAAGLDFWDIVFEVLDSEELNEVAAFGGFPTRYPHWKFGMSYEELVKGYAYGLSKIYEMVINNDPCYAYLMRENSMLDQKLVMAHVCGHADFFKHNMWFAPTDRKMMDTMANHGMRVRSLAEKYGHDKVESFIDACLSLENLIDIHSAYVPLRGQGPVLDSDARIVEAELELRKLRSSEYMDRYVNPPEFLEQQRKLIEEGINKQKSFPEEPQRDILLFLLEHAPLKPWQRTILGFIRDESYYFAPQGMTKVMNEGWACVHAETRVATDQGLLTMAELVAGGASQVSDGADSRAVYDRNIIPNHPTIRLRTRLGLEIEASTNHRIMLADGSWARIDELRLGQRLKIARGAALWPTRCVALQRPLVHAERLSTPGSGATLLLDQRQARRLGEAIADGPWPRVAEAFFEREASPFFSEPMSWVDSAPEAYLPEALYRSPREVVLAFLKSFLEGRGLGLADGQASAIPLESYEFAGELQLLLLQLGVISGRRQDFAGGAALELCAVEKARLQATFKDAGESGSNSKSEPDQAEDEIESLTPGRADVYDISVEKTHRYAAAGFINHNSFWHSELMTKGLLEEGELIEYARRHAGTMASSRGQLNPYKLGIELFRDIEDRWNRGRHGRDYDDCDELERRRAWDLKAGKGREKIFEVRRIYNDITFISEFLTQEFCEAQGLF
jgi:stage V sporulation protein R